MKKIWRKWVRIVRIVVNIQASVILFIIFYLILLPMSLFIRIFSKKSLEGHSFIKKENSSWMLREKIKYSLVWARSQ